VPGQIQFITNTKEIDLQYKRIENNHTVLT
jgi:hypothetical protein